MFCPQWWNLLSRGPFKKGLLVSCCWKTLNSNSLDCFCVFTVSVIWSQKSLSKNLFPEFSDSTLSSFIIDFAWLELFMTSSSALSRLWYDVVLLVYPTRNTVCWTKFNKSSVVKSASSFGEVAALSRACHTLTEVLRRQYFSSEFFQVLCIRYIPMFDYFLSEDGT